MIRFSNVTHIYHNNREDNTISLSDISIDINAGDFVAVIGANGSGKSTFAKHINGLLLPSNGSVVVDGYDTKDKNKIWELRKKVGMVFQNPDNQLVATTIEDDIAFGMENIGIEEYEMRKRVEWALNLVDMADLRNKEPHLLSGGQKQKVVIAGALAMHTSYLVLDEPTSMLDPKGRKEIFDTIKRLNKEEDITIIYITHFMSEAAEFDKIIVLDKGKIALTGTPVENRLLEYWSIFDFTNKSYLYSSKKFKQRFINPIEKEKDDDVLNNFKQLTSPFILRRLKNDSKIITDLPDKNISDIYCNLTGEQAALYQKTLESEMDEISYELGINRKGLIFKLMNSLKQICNHPSQFMKNKSYKIQDSGKMEVLIEILENIEEMGEKTLIFTQYVQMGKIMKKILEKKFKKEILFLHGSLTREKRDKMINEFQNDPSKKIFILSLKVGGIGLNLTAAQNVIHYDLWWNPAVENQATDRAYRIGQKENVMVYRLITSGTFEEQINELIKEKEELAELAIGNGEKFLTEMSNEELKSMFSLR